jgi:hypothetical protein
MARKLLALSFLILGCGDDGAAGVVVLDQNDPHDFYARPFPSDDRKNPDGTIDLSTYPRPSVLIKEYVDEAARDKHGFGENTCIYFRFSGAIDPMSLPQTPQDSLAADASVFLTEVASGQRIPVRTHMRPKGGKYAGANLLAMCPFAGLPLAPQTKYTAAVTTKVHAADGTPIQKGGSTTFTTGDPTSDMKALRDAIVALPAPTPSMLTWQSGGSFDEYDGIYSAPFFQQGTVPFLTPDQGGTIQFDAQGHPQLVRMDQLRFAMTVPKSAMPANGYPMVIYAHGTGGNYRSFITEGLAERLAGVGIAMMSIDQVLHGPRDPTGADPEITFFNFQNMAAARDNVRQGGADDFQLLRLAQNWSTSITLPMTNAQVKFDSQSMAFMGHSQGGLTGPLFVAYEPGVRGAVFSGAAGLLIIALLNKTQPVNIPDVVSTLVNDDPLDEFHPLLSLVQQYFEPADPCNYGRLYFQVPPQGVPAHSIFQTIGLVDHYAPVPGLKAFMLSMGLQPVGMLPDPIDGLDLAGLNVGTAPVSANVAGGAATGVAAEYVATGYDGHFVLFDNTAAQRQSTGFLQSLLAGGPGTLPQ